MKLSVIFPVFSPSEFEFIQKCLTEYKSLEEVELIIIDSSNEKIYEKFSNETIIYENIITNSRAERLNHGANIARGEWLLFHHPRSFLQKESLTELIENTQNLSWGGFTHKFDKDHFLLKFTSWYSNHVRAKRGVLYLDHCIFCRMKDFEKIKGLPHVDIFEDTILSNRLFKLLGKPQLLKGTALTSAIRFETNGVYKQALMNQYLKWMFYFRTSDKKMNKFYEKNTKLNSDYKK